MPVVREGGGVGRGVKHPSESEVQVVFGRDKLPNSESFETKVCLVWVNMALRDVRDHKKQSRKPILFPG